MRHDPAGAAIVIMMRSLKMPGMAQAVQDLHEQGSPAFDAAIPSCRSCSRPKWLNVRCVPWPIT